MSVCLSLKEVTKMCLSVCHLRRSLRCVCLSVCLSVCLYASAYLLVRPSVCLSLKEGGR